MICTKNRRRIARRAAACTTLLVSLFGSVMARELAVMVPPDNGAPAREFLAALSESPQVKEAGLTFRPVPSDQLGQPNDAGALLLQGKVLLPPTEN